MKPHINLWREGEMMNGDVGRALYKRAGELGVPVGFLVSPHNYDEIEALADEFPDTDAIIDHFGHCVPERDGSDVPAFERLLSMARADDVLIDCIEGGRRWANR